MTEMIANRFMERAVILNAAGFDLWEMADLCCCGDSASLS